MDIRNVKVFLIENCKFKDVMSYGNYGFISVLGTVEIILLDTKFKYVTSNNKPIINFRKIGKVSVIKNHFVKNNVNSILNCHKLVNCLIVNCYFAQNYGIIRGAIHVDIAFSIISVIKTQFISNSATSVMAVENSPECTIKFKLCSFINNYAETTYQGIIYLKIAFTCITNQILVATNFSKLNSICDVFEINKVYIIQLLVNEVAHPDALETFPIIQISGRTIIIFHVRLSSYKVYERKSLNILAETIFFSDIMLRCPIFELPALVTDNKILSSCVVKSYCFYAVSKQILFRCERCKGNNYGQLDPKVLISHPHQPLAKPEFSENSCYQCPIGGRCKNGKLYPLSGYWGFVKHGRVFFVACPVGYCCEAKNCRNYSSCNDGRDGLLCSKCKSTFSLRFINDNCILDTGCISHFIIMVLFINAFIYSLLLMVQNSLFDILCSLFNIFKKIILIVLSLKRYIKIIPSKIGTIARREINKHVPTALAKFKTLKHFIHKVPPNLQKGQRKSNAINSCTSKVSVCVEILEIAIYHVQDAELFHLPLPKDGISIPFHISNIYVQYVKKLMQLSIVIGENICLGRISAVIKSLFLMTLFPIILCIYFIVGVFAYFNQSRKCLNSTCIYSCLIQGYISLVSYFYQNLSLTAFKLISCIGLADGIHLLIDGDIQCWQLWQVTMFLYICLFLIPMFLIFLLGPVFLKKNTVSIQTFLLGLICPLPVISFWSYKALGKKKIYTKHSELSKVILRQTSCTTETIAKYFCWKGILWLRRTLLVMCTTLVINNAAKYSCSLLIITLSLGANMYIKPYKSKYTNMVESISLVAQVFIILTSAVASTKLSLSDDKSTLEELNLFLQVGCVLGIIAPIFILIFLACVTILLKVKGYFVEKLVGLKAPILEGVPN